MATQQICACKNTCSGASKRGACPCRQTNRFCSSLCSCGTLKVCCTNQPEKMAVDTPVLECFVEDLTTLRKITTELFLCAPTSFADYAGGYRVQALQGAEPDLPNKPAWCRCGRPMPTARENKCCHRDQKQVLPRGHCVTTTERFRGSVLNPNFVNTMAAGYYDVLCHEEQVSNEAFRYHAYRSYTFLTHGPLGAKNRKVVPSCCVLAIHERYPDPRGQYIEFQLP